MEERMGTILPSSFFFFFFVFFSTTYSSAAMIPLGSTLSPTTNSSWSSPNNTFSLTFLPTKSSPNLYLPSIAYSGTIPIWSPNNITTPLPSSSLLFSLTSTGNLLLLNSSSSSTTILWQSNTSNKGVTSANLDDTGNLRLLNATSSTIWQSFDHPSDTLVQSQNFSSAQTLVSGLYSFSLSSTGNLTLRWNGTILYLNRGNSSLSNGTQLTSPVLALTGNGIVSLSDPSLASPALVAYSSDYGETGDMIRFLRLDPDGNFRAYSAKAATANPTEQWAAVADQCEVFGWCGNNGVCAYNDTGPFCSCPSKNFVPVDANDLTRGCTRKIDLQNCTANWTLVQLENTQYLTYPPQPDTEQYFFGISSCQQNCLSGPACVASTSLADGSGQCFLKVDSFVSAYQSAALPSTSFVKVCAPGDPNADPLASSVQTGSKSKIKASVVVVVGVVLGTVLGLAALELGLWWCFCRNSRKFGPSAAQYALLEYASGAPVQFSYKELHRSTKGFKEKLGAGGFGAVYKGILVNRTTVAVKQLEGIEQGEKQFRMEVATISSTHHLNLVRLIGFCSEGRHRLLVYEFMKNCSLDAFLFSDESSSTKLDWATRFKIAVGTARGITYLHEECRDCIVHCDIKPENILLDEQYNAKVSDFGLAKLINPKDHRHRTLTSTLRGTRGYLAPEWLANLPITSKSDVYSYGMVLLEIVSGRRNFDVSDETGRKKFSIWAYEEFDKGNLENIIDKRGLHDSDVDRGQVERAIQVSFWCILEQPSHRPTMGKVVQMLEGIMEIERPPPPKTTKDGSVGSNGGSVNVSSAISTFAASSAVALSSGSVQLINTRSSAELSTPKVLENASSSSSQGSLLAVQNL